MMRGLFIAVEGCDNSGKTTQAHMLHRHIPGSVLVQFPDYLTPVGAMLQRYVKGEMPLHPRAAQLLFAANRWECADQIRRSLAAGVTVVADRFIASGIAYGSLHCGEEWVCAAEEGLPVPSITLYLRVPAATAASRVVARHAHRSDHRDSFATHALVDSFFLRQSTRGWHHIDGAQSVDMVHRQLVGIVDA
jgi:dTMP kinase